MIQKKIKRSNARIAQNLLVDKVKKTITVFWKEGKVKEKQSTITLIKSPPKI